ncbi:MAG: hypothetical protein LBE78_06420 [Burkholderiaceae bacterium]|nr:hypothetical protein [Burkholderiaceae bacterium]
MIDLTSCGGGGFQLLIFLPKEMFIMNKYFITKSLVIAAVAASALGGLEASAAPFDVNQPENSDSASGQPRLSSSQHDSMCSDGFVATPSSVTTAARGQQYLCTGPAIRCKTVPRFKYKEQIDDSAGGPPVLYIISPVTLDANGRMVYKCFQPPDSN